MFSEFILVPFRSPVFHVLYVAYCFNLCINTYVHTFSQAAAWTATRHCGKKWVAFPVLCVCVHGEKKLPLSVCL